MPALTNPGTATLRPHGRIAKPIAGPRLAMCRKAPAVAVDCVVFDDQDRLLLVGRRRPPFAGQFALPGGFVEYGEETEAAARRELEEETGLVARQLRLVGVYSRPDRDPRGHTISVAYLIAAEPQA